MLTLKFKHHGTRLNSVESAMGIDFDLIESFTKMTIPPSENNPGFAVFTHADHKDAVVRIERTTEDFIVITAEETPDDVLDDLSQALSFHPHPEPASQLDKVGNLTIVRNKLEMAIVCYACRVGNYKHFTETEYPAVVATNDCCGIVYAGSLADLHNVRL